MLISSLLILPKSSAILPLSILDVSKSEFVNNIDICGLALLNSCGLF